MSNYHPNGPGPEQRPRDQGWATRREQHRAPYSNRSPQPQWNPNSGESSGDGRRNNASQPRPTGNRPDYPSSGQYVPLSRRNQFDGDRRQDLRTEGENRPFRRAGHGPPSGPGLRQPPTGPRDNFAYTQHNGRGEGGDSSRRHDARNDRYVPSASEPHRSSHTRDAANTYRHGEEPSVSSAGLNTKDVDMDESSSRRSRKESALDDAVEPPRKRARRSPSYEPYDKKPGQSQDPRVSTSLRDRGTYRDVKRNSTDTRRSSFRDDRSDAASRNPGGDRHREKEDIKHRHSSDRHERRNGGRDFDDDHARGQASHRKTSYQEYEGSQEKRGGSRQDKYHSSTSKKYSLSPRSAHRHRRDSPARSRKDHDESSRRDKHQDAARPSKSAREIRHSPSVSTRGRRRARSSSISSSDSDRSRSRRRRRYSRSSSSSSDRYRQRRRGRSPRSSSPESGRRERRRRKYESSPETSRSPSPKRAPRPEERNRPEPREPQQLPTRVWQANNGNGSQRNGGLAQTRSGPVKIAMPVVAPRQAPGAPAKFRDQPPPPSRPQDNGYSNRGPRIQQSHQHNGQVGPGAEASQTVPPASTGPPYIPDIRASLQMQHAIYEDMLASAAPEVKDVLAALIRSDPNFTADVDSFWLHMTRQLPTPEQLQMLRVLQGQYMVICELERQAELETAYAKNVADNSITSHAAEPAGPEHQGLQPTGTDIASQASEAVTQTESKKSTQQDRRVEEGAKAEKVKRREAKPAQPYEKIAQVGEGTYGKVYKARNSDGLGLVALKRIRMEGEKDGFPVTAMREIKLLQGLDHVNIVKLHEMMIHNGSVHMVMEYMDHDLSGILSQPQITLSVANLKSFCQQMLRGLAYLHGKAILHRDMKGSNILINSKGELKLADFGLARYFTKRKRNDYTNRVVTLWYRSPELLLGETMYDVCIDNWSAGCIMLELFVRKPVFQGNDEIHQLEAIYEIMGTPTEEEWPGLASMPWYELVKPKEMVPSKFDEYFSKRLNTAGTELAKGLLHYDPAKRLTADQALESPFFNSEEPAPEMPTHIADIVGEWHEMEAKHERARRKQRET